MSNGSSKSAPNPPQTMGGMRSQSSKTRSQGPPASKSDWLALTIVAAKMITAAGECLPFLCVKGAFGMVVILLETVEVWFIVVYVEDKVKKNRDDLKELCMTAMEIMYILQDQISSHGDTSAVKLKGLCEDFERFLEDVIHGVEDMRKKPQGFGSYQEFVKSSSVQDKIAEYQKKIQEICSRLKIYTPVQSWEYYHTTRNPALRGYAGAHFAVSDMEETDAVALLLKSAGKIFHQLVKKLQLDCETLDSYLDIYMKNRAQLLSEKPAQSHDNYAWTVYTTWQMSFDKLSPLAAMFLQLCSFLHWDGISEEIFSRAARYRFQMAIPSREELQKPLQFLAHFLEPAGGWDTLRFLKVTNEIKAYSLMTFDPERKMFAIHPLVHSWSQITITDQQSYHPIMAAIMGRSEEAKGLYLAVLKKRKQVLGDDHPDTLRTMGNLASTYWHLGKFQQAEELQVVVLEKRKHDLGDDHPDTLRYMGNLASTYRSLGKFQRAEELEVVVVEKQNRFLEMTTQTLFEPWGIWDGPIINLGIPEGRRASSHSAGEAETDTILTMSSLGCIYCQLGQFQKAEELQAIALERSKTFLGDNHPATLHTMRNLALTYRCLDKLSEAEELEAHVRDYEEHWKVLSMKIRKVQMKGS
ncbi:hypothetical protein B0H13DRAFT_2274711 [Mycena leptocephala]|nr:hypothetical protein B0H13DRAFT_2274711 [Mycena leptocephala]